MALVASLWLLETIWTLDLLICQLRTQLHTNWCLIASRGTEAQNDFHCRDLNLWPDDNMWKTSLITPHFFFLLPLTERVVHCAEKKYFFLIRLRGGRSLRNECHYETIQCITSFPLMGLISFTGGSITPPKVVSCAWLPWGKLDDATLGRWERANIKTEITMYKSANESIILPLPPSLREIHWFYCEL